MSATGDGDTFGAGGFNTGLTHTEPDGIAWFRLVFGVMFGALGAGVLVVFFKSRHVLEIRSRSAYLVTVLGACMLVDILTVAYVECEHLFRWPSSVFALHLIHFFLVFTIESCYISRVIRLGVAFAPKLRSAIPWIMSEKLLVVVSITIGCLSMFIPGYYHHVTEGSDFLVRDVLRELDVVWKCQVGLVSIQLCLLPIVWMVDDVFRISWELAIIVMLGVVDIVIIKLSETSILAPGVKNYINSANIFIVWVSVLFLLSVVDPVRRLKYDPMARPSSVSRKIHSKKANRGPNADEPPSRTLNAESSIRARWSYDRVTAVPAAAEAFRAFAWRALCQESVLFLEEVSKYEIGNYIIARPVMSQFAAFNAIVKRFIAEGSRDEINIGSRDKQKLVDTFTSGASVFFALNDQERRLIFGEAFLEIRSMLETNLLHRFLHTDGFKSVDMDTPEVVAVSVFGSSTNDARI